MQQHPAGGINFGEAGVGLDKTDRDALGVEGLFPYVVRLLEALFHIAENKVREISDIALLELIHERCARGEGVLRGSDVDWQEYRVVGGCMPELILNNEEILWLRKSWAEATGG